MGILVGLNVIDCNLCFKEEDLDSQQGVIDFSLYLRTSSRTSPDDENVVPVAALEGPAGNFSAVLDQKNYIEELNRHLKYVCVCKLTKTKIHWSDLHIFSATVANLQSKVEGLTTTNALMKEDLAIARNSLLALQAENLALRRNAQQGNTDVRHENTSNVLDQIDPEMAQAMATEKKKRLDVERELELQVLYCFFFFIILILKNRKNNQTLPPSTRFH